MTPVVISICINLPSDQMHVNVNVLADIFAVAVSGEETVEWLMKEAVKRYGQLWNADEMHSQSNALKQRSAAVGSANNNNAECINDPPSESDLWNSLIGRIVAMRRQRDQAILNKSDLIADVLKDGENVVAGNALFWFCLWFLIYPLCCTTFIDLCDSHRSC